MEPGTPMAERQQLGFPSKQGLYDPAHEKDGCGVGFIAQLDGQGSHQTILDADTILRRLNHRGACGSDAKSGDGAGILTALPHRFLNRVVHSDLRADLPLPGAYGVGNVFLPWCEDERRVCKQIMEGLLESHALKCLGWRPLPTRPELAGLGETARRSAPAMEQLVVVSRVACSPEDLEAKLYQVRKQASHAIRIHSKLRERLQFYLCSLSTKTLVYKGMLTPNQLVPFFPDLGDPDYESHFAIVHSRFSTNTFPSWDRAQPLRMIGHNGEINTLRGNTNWMRAREGMARSPVLGSQLANLLPVIEPDCSDSGSFDNVLEFLVRNGRSLPEAMMMMVPEAWQKHATMSAEQRAFYEYHSCLMEPWDGPAAILFTDGDYLGAILDRNGLRPGRYCVTTDNRVILASEVGVLEVAPEAIQRKGRIQPGEMFLIDFRQGRIVGNEEIKQQVASQRPYADWLSERRICLSTLDRQVEMHGYHPDTLIPRLQAFGYTVETMHFLLMPMIREARDPIGSMGNDAALACLSDKPRLVSDYFRQLFAQVTNPAIDPIREEIILSLECYIGPEQNLLESTPEHAHRLRLANPILTNDELASLVVMRQGAWKTKVIDITFDRKLGESGLERTLDRVCAETEAAIEEGFTLVVLSDRAIGHDRVAVSALMVCGAVHHHLVRQAKRTRIGLVVETGEAREVHHHCLLIGYGADAINPYLAFEALWKMKRDGRLDGILSQVELVKAYRASVEKGLLKVMAKMGISTLQSYKGAQIFEALGLKSSVIDKCFTGTSSRIQGCGFEILARESLRRHALGYPENALWKKSELSNQGEFHWRAEGEKHGWDPQAIAELQTAARQNDPNAYWRFAAHIDSDSQMRCALRGLLKFKLASQPTPLEEVESATSIVKRFCTGAMSLGSISAEAHETIAIAMNRMQGKSNTGEGGEDAIRFVRLANGDSKRSAIKQVASGRFGVTIDYLTHADELQIKISQGAKPGEGGELPGTKVDENIARIRHSTPGVGLISPPPHHDIYSIEDLSQLIYDLKNANPSARISVKLVSEVGVGVVSAGVAKAHAEHIVISGDVGGTGASPLTSIKHAGLPWELGLAETHQCLVLNNLRSRVVLQTDGGLKTGRDVTIAALLGAEEFGFATAPLISLGCIMMRKCHLNTCPVGIATQDPLLRERFRGQPEHVVNYLFMVAEDVRRWLSRLGMRSLREIVGKVELLEADKAIQHWKTDGLDLTSLLQPAKEQQPGTITQFQFPQDHRLEESLDVREIVPRCQRTLADGTPTTFALSIRNENRTVGTILSHEIARRIGAQGLADDSIRIAFKGSAGQSFGAFLARGVTLSLEGDANDYVGKGLSGGRLVVFPPRESGFPAEENIVVGNVCLYGATSGEVFFRGQAAERFAVRNSGAIAVVEGVGDHGCEYMTGGCVLILGGTGRNFAAGMSGGIAFVLDERQEFHSRCNLEMVDIEALSDPHDQEWVRSLLGKHQRLTGSTVAARLLAEGEPGLQRFLKVVPKEWKRVVKNHQWPIEAGHSMMLAK